MPLHQVGFNFARSNGQLNPTAYSLAIFDGAFVRMIRKAVFVILAVAVSACTSHGSNMIRDASAIEKIVVGESTKQEIFALLGQPHDVRTFENGTSDWVYFSEKTSIHWGTFIPYLGYITNGDKVDEILLHIPFEQDVVSAPPESSQKKSYVNGWVSLVRINKIDRDPSTKHIRIEMESLSLPFDKEYAKDGLMHLEYFSMGE